MTPPADRTAALPHIMSMQGYAPGEQPRDGVFIKLNTNENPYPPSPQALEAIRAAATDRLRLYPDPIATEVREAAATLHGVDPGWILVGNGSDDLLTILTRAFVGPGDRAFYPTPSYVLYRTLIELQGARPLEVAFREDWSLDPAAIAGAVPGASIGFLANPNSPSGTSLAPAVVADLARRLDCPLVVDEAYADFADADCVSLLNDCDNVIVLRTLSKGYGLAGLRLGYLIARPAIVEQLIKVKDSYNCDRLSIAAGAAALRDRPHIAATRARIIATRERLVAALRGFGYTVPDSQANFAWCTGGLPAVDVFAALRARGILVRMMRYPAIEPSLRITVGTDDEIDALLQALAEIHGRR